MSDEIDPNAPSVDSGGQGDINSKTLAILRRILVGNGYKIEEIQLRPEDSQEIVIPGRFDLELTTSTNTSRHMGLPRGGEQQVFRTRDDYSRYMASLNQTLAQDTSWVDEVRALTASKQAGTWGLEQASWPLKRLSQRIALVLPCDYCRGQKFEVCQICNGQREVQCQLCYQQGRIQCPTCHGTGSNPQDRSGRPCIQCQGMRTIPCHQCQTRGLVPCHTCNSTGQIQCRECQGHGTFTEETQVQVAATGRFTVGSATSAPPTAVMDVVDRIGINSIGKGHATITADPSMNSSGEAAIFTRAVVPYTRFQLNLGGHELPIEAVGFKPVLHDFPPLLDDALKPVVTQLDFGTLPKFGRQFRLIRELTEALAGGSRPKDFFAKRYPYGISADVALSLASQIRQLFSGVTTRPRSIAAVVSVAASLGLVYWWLYNPRPEFLPPDIPIYVWDGGLILLLAVVAWTGVEMAGRRALKSCLPSTARIAATGGLIGWGAFAAVLLGGIFLLWLPDTRPEWFARLLAP
jgi:hypothetical protein